MSIEKGGLTRVNEGSQPWRPHGYQKAAVKFMISNGAAGLLLDPG